MNTISHRRCLTIALLAPAILSLPAAAQSPAALGAASQGETLSEAVRQLLIDALPAEFEDHDDWGQTKQVTKGFRLKTNDGKLRLEKRKKEVRHGLWKRYRVSLVDPNERLHLRIGDVRQLAPGRIGFTLFLAARTQGEARVERWRQGVKLLNFTTEAQSTIEAKLDCELGLRLMEGKLLAGLVMDPVVKSLELRLADFDLVRVSKLDGPAAHELGNGLRGTIERELRDQEPKVIVKLNKAIADHRESLVIAPEKLILGGWSKLAAALGAT